MNNESKSASVHCENTIWLAFDKVLPRFLRQHLQEVKIRVMSVESHIEKVTINIDSESS